MNGVRALHIDLLAVAWLALLLALPAYALVRKTSPLARWNEHGNVYTGVFGRLDLVVVVFFFLVVQNAALFWPQQAAQESAIAGAGSASVSGLALSCLAMLVLTGMLALGLALRREVSLAELWGLQRLGWKQALGWSLFLAALIVPVTLLVADRSRVFLQQRLGEIPTQPLAQAFLADDRVSFRIALAATAVVIAPVFEEVFYRGYLYAVIKRYSDRFFAAVFSSLVFAVNHEGVISYAPLFVLALFLAVSYELSGSLWIPVGVHALFNAASLTGMLFFGGGEGVPG